MRRETIEALREWVKAAGPRLNTATSIFDFQYEQEHITVLDALDTELEQTNEPNECSSSVWMSWSEHGCRYQASCTEPSGHSGPHRHGDYQWP